MDFKKVSLISISVLFLILGASMFWMIQSDREYTKADKVYPVKRLNIKDSIFSVGIIGDSWVSHKGLVKSFEETMIFNGINSNVKSFSLPGRKSGEIYVDLISKPTSQSNSYSLLNNKEVDAVVIIAGVNDAAGHIGSDYYVQNMKNIISEINSKGKKAFILELPEFGIEEPEAIPSSIKHGLYRWIFDGGEKDIISDYRKELENELAKTDHYYEVIPFNSFIEDYYSSKDSYSNPFHLNAEAYSDLGTHLGNHISKQWDK